MYSIAYPIIFVYIVYSGDVCSASGTTEQPKMAICLTSKISLRIDFRGWKIVSTSDLRPNVCVGIVGLYRARVTLCRRNTSILLVLGGADGARSTEIDRENKIPGKGLLLYAFQLDGEVVREYPLNECRYIYFFCAPKNRPQLDVTVHIKWIKVAFVANTMHNERMYIYQMGQYD